MLGGRVRDMVWKPLARACMLVLDGTRWRWNAIELLRWQVTEVGWRSAKVLWRGAIAQ
jgi:hypothetical protein